MSGPKLKSLFVRLVHSFVAGFNVQLRSYQFVGAALITTVVQPAVFIIMHLHGQGASSGFSSSHLMLAAFLSSVWTSVVWSSVTVLRADRQNGSLPIIIVSGGSLSGSTLGRCSALVIINGAISLLTVGTIALVSGSYEFFTHIDRVGIAYVFAIVSGTPLSLFIGTVLVGTPFGNRIAGLITYPVLLVSGLLIPINAFPSWVAGVSNLLSIRWIYVWATNSELSLYSWELSTALILGCMYGAAGMLLMKRMTELSGESGEASVAQ